MKILSDLPFSFLSFYVQETFIGTPRPYLYLYFLIFMYNNM